MARKLKVRIKLDNFYIPIPAIPLSIISGLSKIFSKYFAGKLPVEVGQQLGPEEISRLINVLKDEEPFELVNIDVEDKDNKVAVEVYTK